MNHVDFDRRLERLRANLRDLANLLRDHGESHWSEWATTCSGELKTYDDTAVDHVLRVYGGMGSLNDLWILKQNGHTIGPAEESAINGRISELRHAIWDDATALRGSAQASS